MKQALKTEKTKEKILAAAMAEFGRNGYRGSSLNTICGSGIPKGLLYHNYANKDALYLACVSFSFHELTGYLKKETAGTDLKQYAKARLMFFKSHEDEARIFFEAILQPPDALREEISAIRAEFDEFNETFCRAVFRTVRLRNGITENDAIHYFRLTQDMFNCYFSSPSLCGLSFTDTLDAHEKGLVQMLDFMLYGIAERKDSK